MLEAGFTLCFVHSVGIWTSSIFFLTIARHHFVATTRPLIMLTVKPYINVHRAASPSRPPLPTEQITTHNQYELVRRLQPAKMGGAFLRPCDTQLGTSGSDEPRWIEARQANNLLHKASQSTIGSAVAPLAIRKSTRSQALAMTRTSSVVRVLHSTPGPVAFPQPEVGTEYILPYSPDALRLPPPARCRAVKRATTTAAANE